MTVNPAVVEWLGRRGIDPETVARMGIYSGRRRDIGAETSVEPHAKGNIIAFPFVDRGEVVAEKYRTADKKFWQRPGGRKTFYNADVLDDPALREGTAALVITEGEIDCLSVMQAGYPFVVSVPDGAPPGVDASGNPIPVPEDASDVNPVTDDKFRFVFNNWDRLQAVKRIVVATDDDDPGRRLAAELVRRLGRVRCSFVLMPDGCKDFNDVLVRHGPAEVSRALAQAKPYPVSGLYRPSEFPCEPDLTPVTTGWPELVDLLKPYHPALMVVTGFANAGKSTWATQLAAQLARLHGWRAAIASFEMRIKPFVTGLLERNAPALGSRTQWLEDHFVFISPDPEREEDTTLEWLLDKASAAVIRYGVRVVLLDPWNEIDHGRAKDETVTDYVGRALRMVKRFARRFDVLVIIVAHPSKGAISKSPDQLSLYDVADTAHFANKADLGVVVVREGLNSLILVKKVRYQPETGKPGEARLYFDPSDRLFVSAPSVGYSEAERHA